MQSWGGLTIGASGAVFGLMGAAMVGLRRRGVNPWQTGIGMLVIINVVFTFLAPSVSIGGHLGGFVGGAVAGVPVFHLGRRRDNGDLAAAWGVVAGLAGLALLAGVTGPWW